MVVRIVFCCEVSLILFVLLLQPQHHSTTTHSFQYPTKYYQRWQRSTVSNKLLYGYTNNRGNGNAPYDRRRSNGSGGSGDIKSKRQERVAQIVKTEISQIIHSGLIKGVNAEYLDDELRTRISVVNADVSPDLRQARLSISIRPTPRNSVTQQIVNDSNVDDDNEDDDDNYDDIGEEDNDEIYDDNDDDYDSGDADEEEEADQKDESANISVDGGFKNLQEAILGQQQGRQMRTSPAVDRRRAFAWLVRNTKPIRYTLAQRMSHMKSCPDLTFVQVDVSAAVDVMYLIDKLSSSDGKYKRDNLNLFNDDDVARGIVGGLDFDAVEDDYDDDLDWDEEGDEGIDYSNEKPL